MSPLPEVDFIRDRIISASRVPTILVHDEYILDTEAKPDPKFAQQLGVMTVEPMLLDSYPEWQCDDCKYEGLPRETRTCPQCNGKMRTKHERQREQEKAELADRENAAQDMDNCLGCGRFRDNQPCANPDCDWERGIDDPQFDRGSHRRRK